MMQYTTIIISTVFIFLFSVTTTAQCLSGNCNNGKGKFDFSWCVYEGEFKNGKPEGTGTMTYSDYTYTGHFKNGVEDGAGEIIYKDGRKENVTYYAGRKSVGPAKIAPGDYKPLEGSDPGCVSGDCVNGYGTYEFKSGNKYSGNFKDRKREGEGTAYYTDGDKFSGTWRNNEKAEGTYTFSGGAKYTGTYDANGTELNGRLLAKDREVIFVKGKGVLIPQAPKVTYVKSNRVSGQQQNQEQKEIRSICPVCRGMGKTHELFYHGAIATDKYGNRTTVFGAYSTCTRCKGAGTLGYMQ